MKRPSVGDIVIPTPISPFTLDQEFVHSSMFLHEQLWGDQVINNELQDYTSDPDKNIIQHAGGGFSLFAEEAVGKCGMNVETVGPSFCGRLEDLDGLDVVL